MNWRKWISAGVISAVLALSGPPVTPAQSWLEKGRDVLQNLTTEPTSQELGTETIASGLKEALQVGTANVVQQLGQSGGFYDHPDVHIPLPESLDKVQAVLEKLGASSMLDDLELRLNRAAEQATPKAKAIFWQAIGDMTLADARSIYNGPDDAATRYFQETTTPELATEMRPVVRNTLNQVGAVQSYDRIMNRYTSVPFVPDVKANLETYTVDKTLEGIFTILAREEAAIRSEPAKRSTELLRKVFGK